jgi:hypothetical protein
MPVDIPRRLDDLGAHDRAALPSNPPPPAFLNAVRDRARSRRHRQILLATVSMAAALGLAAIVLPGKLPPASRPLATSHAHRDGPARPATAAGDHTLASLYSRNPRLDPERLVLPDAPTAAGRVVGLRPGGRGIEGVTGGV